MCGRFALITPGEDLVTQFGVEAQAHLLKPGEPTARYNIAPTQPVTAIRAAGAEEEQWAFFHWGLIPSWAKDPAMGSRMINARSETAAAKPSFRAAFKRRRCLIPMDGFYEWRKIAGGKQPYFIHMADRRPFAAAGLWEMWFGPDGSELESCTILTTTPNELVAELHNRMPVILDPADYDPWLHDDRPDQLNHLLRPFSAAPMAAYPVSTYVNNPRNEGPACVVPS
jgi:putative SOS response-associated peptidase YedK